MMRHRLVPLVLLLTASACSVAPPVESPPATAIDRLVARVVAAYGGRDALARLGTSRTIATVTPHVRHLGGAGRTVRHFAAPDRLRVEIIYPAKTEVRILNGEQGWRGDARSVTPVEGPAIVAMRSQLLRMQPAWTLFHHRDHLTLGETSVRDGTRHRTLRLAWSNELAMDYAVEEATGRVTVVDARLQFGRTLMTFATEYSEFETVDGALVPMVEENYAADRHTATTRIESVALGVGDLGPFTGPHQ